jgi:hypothetical protein
MVGTGVLFSEWVKYLSLITYSTDRTKKKKKTNRPINTEGHPSHGDKNKEKQEEEKNKK